ncbi:Uma2 family endonuclease [Actinomadura sp. NBRC 104412]|uniref:Uma2 family endonuclease n=1 Tax=Actinomadura sp. NBRC 104412 TaxID=3032203 RepID=UPI0025547F3B|nr:Uma2 family endonuclease [Actinomadura sp. NBRC 104412]
MTQAVTSELIEASHGTDGSLYDLWKSGALVDLLEIPDGVNNEIIGGKYVVSPTPTVPHACILQDISDAFARASVGDPQFAWTCLQVVSLRQESVEDQYIPDLVVLLKEMRTAARKAAVRGLMPDEIEMAVEVTSPGGAGRDRPPTTAHRRARKQRRTKWNGYAAIEIPYYLLVDRSPKAAKTTLYSIPDRGAGAYLHKESWEFGETLHLPEPFDIEIETTEWEPWWL